VTEHIKVRKGDCDETSTLNVFNIFLWVYTQAAEANWLLTSLPKGTSQVQILMNPPYLDVAQW